MTPERIEEQLRSQPPDEPAYDRELLIRPRLIRATAPARIRGTTPRPLLAAAVLAVLVGLVLVPFVAGPLEQLRNSAPPSATPLATPRASTQLGVIPWSDATPTPPASATPDPTQDPRTFPTCTLDDVAIAASGWAGGGGSLEGGVEVIGLRSDSCTVGGKPRVELLDARGSVIAATDAAQAASGSDAVVLPVGGVARVSMVWSNWCGTPPAQPLAARVSLPGDAREVVAPVHDSPPGSTGDVPRCDAPGAGALLGVIDTFVAPQPSSRGNQPQACAAGDLGAYLGRWGAAAGTLYANLAVLNVGGVDCLLETSPTFEVRDRMGKRLFAADRGPAGPPGTVLLPPGWAATVPVGFTNWCTPLPALPLKADILIASARIPVEAAELPVPTCMATPATPPPTLFYQGPLAIPGAPIAPEPDPTDTLPISVTLSPLPTTAPGGTLDYTATLTNISAFDKPLNLAASCPAYSQSLLLPGRAPIVTRLRLNCDSAGAFPPHLPVAFQMRLQIPADAPAGPAGVLWQLGERGPSAKATVTIVP